MGKRMGKGCLANLKNLSLITIRKMNKKVAELLYRDTNTNIGYTMTASRFSAYTPPGRSPSGVYTKPTSGRSITDWYHGKRRC